MEEREAIRIPFSVPEDSEVQEDARCEASSDFFLRGMGVERPHGWSSSKEVPCIVWVAEGVFWQICPTRSTSYWGLVNTMPFDILVLHTFRPSVVSPHA